MFANRYTAIIDACSLVSVWRRNLLLTLAEAEFFRARWSAEILGETERALAKIHAKRGCDDSSERAAKAVASMRRAFPEAEVHDYQSLVGACSELPDPNDRHVLAAALRTQAQAIVTENMKHFPSRMLEEQGLEVRSADDFIADTIALDEGRAVAAIREMRERLKNPAISAEIMLRSMEAHSLTETASILSGHAASL